MAIYDSSELESKLPEIIDKMTNPFNSHQPLLALAHLNQVEYVTAYTVSVSVNGVNAMCGIFKVLEGQ